MSFYLTKWVNNELLRSKLLSHKIGLIFKTAGEIACTRVTSAILGKKKRLWNTRPQAGSSGSSSHGDQCWYHLKVLDPSNVHTNRIWRLYLIHIKRLRTNRQVSQSESDLLITYLKHCHKVAYLRQVANAFLGFLCENWMGYPLNVWPSGTASFIDSWNSSLPGIRPVSCQFKQKINLHDTILCHCLN